MKSLSIKYFMPAIIFALHSFEIKAGGYWSDAGNYDISWYTTDSNIYISTPSELAGVAYLVNNNFTDFSRQTIHLTSDIDLSSKFWSPIGHKKTFKGSIDGHGHSVKVGNGYNSGFISNMESGSITSLTLRRKEITHSDLDTRTVGVLVDKASKCIFQNLDIVGSISFIERAIYKSTSWSTKIYHGGVVGIASECTFTDVKSEFEQSLLFGHSDGSSLFGYFYLYTGGIVGYGDGGNKYLRCESSSNFNNTVYGYEADSYYNVKGSTCIYCGGIMGKDLSSSNKLDF